ncbi:MAG TPA: polysaccharide lyase beta-sandwich domain-containing protein, partial [Balneolaceae bacterium]|nr:polysaccharide lyase beta-sandwich domain-containing protein [Balneolaceae bacterium]
QPENVHVDAVQQTGSWCNVYTDGTQKSISRDVFNLWIDHGSGPKSASYAYMIKPGIDQERFSELLKSPTVHILSNTTEVQAIQDEDAGLTQIVFYKEGNLRIDGNNEITVNTPCMIMVQRVTQGLKMTVAVPPELPNDVSITMMGHYEGKHCNYDNKKKETTIAFTLPDGIQAGKSVSRILMKD